MMVRNLELFFPEAFDYIIVDECHHATAATYRQIIAYFHPDFLLGLTATPERMDNEDVFQLFDQNVPYELRLRDAIINGLVVPFHYYGIRDKFINYNLQGMKGHRFIESFSTEEHCDFICSEIEKPSAEGRKIKGACLLQKCFPCNPDAAGVGRAVSHTLSDGEEQRRGAAAGIQGPAG